MYKKKWHTDEWMHSAKIVFSIKSESGKQYNKLKQNESKRIDMNSCQKK